MTNPTSGLGATNGAIEEVKLKKMKRKVKKAVKKASVSLKMVISRTFSEGAKVNIGNYQSRDFFCSATRSMEIALPTSLDEQEEVSALLFAMVKQDVKEALKSEVDDAAGVKPGDMRYVPITQEEAPSIPDAFESPKREVPWNKFKPREDNDDLDVLE